jgi:hypothetical protein
MKKVILATILFLAVSINMQAQLVKLGIKGGINYANQSGTDITVNSINYNSTDAITSYHIGLVAELKLTDGLAIQPELLYSTQGATYKADQVINDFSNKIGYISIPVLAKISLNKSISLDLGPQASFLLSEKNQFDYKNSKTFEFAAAGGLTLKVTKSLFIQGRYVLGLTEASKDAQIKNSALQVSAGILF